MNKRSKWALWLITALLVAANLAWSSVARAQDPTPAPEDGSGVEPLPPAAESDGSSADELTMPLEHVVEEGETLIFIAELYGTTVDALSLANGLDQEGLIFVGQSLIIPGGQGESVPVFYTVQVGDTLSDLAQKYNTTTDELAAHNRLLNPGQLIAGQRLDLISHTGSPEALPLLGRPHIVASGETALGIAARYNLSPATLLAANDLSYGSALFPGQRLRLPADTAYQSLPGEWVQIQLQSAPAAQGETLVIYVENLLEGVPEGALAGQPLRFTERGSGYVALVGLDAFQDTGLYDLQLEGSGQRPWYPFGQGLRIDPAGYGTQFVTVSDALSPLLDPQVRAAEDAYLGEFYGLYSSEQLWEGVFQAPVTTTLVSAGYGDSRSYNGGPITIFHTGVDYAAPSQAPVVAPAAGVVVFSEATQLRGNVIIIDHGLGVTTGYYHLAVSLVEPGQMVDQGEVIGAVGSTGLSSGAHLHWELRVGNVPVDGRQWLQQEFP